MDKRDAIELEIVQGLLAAGRSVERLPGSHGRPDLLVGWGRRHMVLMEVKDPDEGRMQANQIEWHRRWRGPPPVVVRSLEQALAATGVRMASSRPS
jgi:hypothetical protein